MQSVKILIVEDDPKMRSALLSILRKDAYEVDAVETGEQGLAQLAVASYDLLITDLKLPGMSGLELLTAAKESSPDLVAVMITAYASVDSAVQAIKAGADDYLPKPFSLEEIRLVVRKVLQKRNLIAENRFLHEQILKQRYSGNLVGGSEAMNEVHQLIDRVKDSKTTVLVLGETGTGKELVARAIHTGSVRAKRLFLPVNCAALNENLLESELFGHVKGSFTGATRDKTGIFAAADEGTVFLDEVGDLGANLQQKLLRVLQDGEIQPVGSVARKKVNVRVIAATNRDLAKMVEEKTFRKDLYYRVNVVSIRLPPLRERRDDIAPLAAHFLRRYAAENKKDIHGFSSAAVKVLEQYNWPGNVRELENAIERAVLFEAGEIVTSASLPPTIRQTDVPVGSTDNLPKTIDEVVREHVEQTLVAAGQNKAKAAEMLGIDRSSLWRMIKRVRTDKKPPDV